MPLVRPTVQSLDELALLLAWPGPEGPIDRIQIERATSQGGAYSNIGTVTVVSGRLAYTFYDVVGDNDDWYRWYFSNAANTFPISAQRTYSDAIQPAVAGGLICSLGDVKQRLGIPASDTNHDEDLLDFIRQAQAEIQSPAVTGQLFVRTPVIGTTTFLVDVDVEGDTVWFADPIAELTQLEYALSTQPGSGGVYTVLATSAYDLRPIRRSAYEPYWSLALNGLGALTTFAEGRNILRVTGAKGWPRVPDDVVGIATTSVARRWRTKASGGEDQAIVGPAGNTILRHLSPAEAQYLEDNYRTPVVG